MLKRNASDEELAQFLARCDPEFLGVVVHALHSVVSYDSRKYFGDILDGNTRVAECGTVERQVQVACAMRQLKYFGSNSLAYGLRKLSPWHSEAGVSYSAILGVAHIAIAKQVRPNATVATLDTVASRELDIATMLMNKAIRDIPDQELVEMLQETGMSLEAAAQSLKQLRNPTLGAGALLAAGNFLGKRFTRDFLLAALTAYVSNIAKREGAKELAIQLAKRVPQKAFLRLSNYVGLAFLAWDAYKLTGPAMRVTVPTVAALSIFRSVERLRDADAPSEPDPTEPN